MKLNMTSITCWPLRTVPALALIAGFAMFPGTAVGAAPMQFHDHFAGSFSDNFCGIPVEVNFVSVDNFFLYADGSSKDTGSFNETITNPANGKTVTVSSAGQTTVVQTSVDEGANTVTFIVSNKGLPEKIQTPNGPVLSRDAGLLMRTLTFNLTTGDFISSATTVNNGPHPEADSDFALFCEIITAALT
jgi:hypothetical protein